MRHEASRSTINVSENSRGAGIMDRFDTVTVRNSRAPHRDSVLVENKVGDSSIDFLLGARIDSDWIVRKSRTKFNADVAAKLKKAVYQIGQGGRRWFSGGGELSARQASTILDYMVLIEILLERDDLGSHRDDVLDCREQLLMQISRYTEGQPERVVSLAQFFVQRFQQQLGEEQHKAKPR
jgi:hypothetical protein